MNSHRKTLKVGPGDLDALNHVNNVRYLEWVQEISGEHWELQAKTEWKERYFWVVRSHRIEYVKSAVSGDQLELETFVKDSRGPLSERVVAIRHSETGNTITKCHTLWCLLDRRTERPVRIPEDIRKRFEESEGNPN